MKTIKLSLRRLFYMIKPYFDTQEEREWRKEISRRKLRIDEDKQNNQPFAD